MEELINWFCDANFAGVELNIQPEETLFSSQQVGYIRMRMGGASGAGLVLVDFHSFVQQKMAMTYLARALGGSVVDSAKNWTGWRQTETGGWLSITSDTSPIKELLKAISTSGAKDGKDIGGVALAQALGRLIAGVYPAEYWPLIWQPDPNVYLVSRTFLNNYETYNLIVLLLKQVIQADSLAAGRANQIYQPRPPYITGVGKDNMVLCNGAVRPIPGLVAALDQITARLSEARVGIPGAISINTALLPSEEELYSQDWLVYEMLLCAIQNFTQFKLDNYSMPTPVAAGSKKLGDNIRVFRVQYNDLSLAKRFDPLMTQTGKTLFHGSALQNWYSIFYNGLYDGTKSKLLLNGAAYGVGIYLSDNFSTSLGYSMGRIIQSTDDTPYLIGVFQLETPDVKTYKKSTNIFVVDKADILALRYLIWVDKPVDSKKTSPSRISGDDLKILNDYFISDGAARHTIAETQLKSSKGIVRKQKEMQKMFEQQNDPSCGLEYKFDLPDEDNINKWLVSVSRKAFFDTDPSVALSAQTPLYQDMVACSVEYINFEITLPDDYPLSPPFIRIITPRFVHLTGHITIGGSICSELLMKQNWVPTLSILKVMIIVCHNMVDGVARLDRGPGLLRPYTFTEAESAYNRMIRTHGTEWAGGKK
jgi:hypothetical protein